MQKIKRFLVNRAFAVSFFSVLGLATGYGLANMQFFNERASLLASVYPVFAESDELPLINPLVAFESPETTDLREYVSLKEHLQDVIARFRTEQPIETVSVYYRNLNTGRWIAIDQHESYYPASLLKVPAMIAYFMERRSDVSLFDEYVTYKHIRGESQFEVESVLEVGRAYSILELIELMIVHSDNGATYTLLENIDEDVLSAVYTDLGIPDPGEDSIGYRISTKTYATFFRILYNATYLGRRLSEEALELLSKTTYERGLLAGLPDGITVAHKFGEHVINEGSAAKGVELHDCGIVYAPNHPYLLCVMTRADTLPAAESAISLVSKTVYEAVKNEGSE